MTLRQKFLTFILLIFFSVSVLTIFLVDDLVEQINKQWAEKLTQQRLNFDKQKALLPIMDELKLVEQLSKEKSIINMALYENDKKILKQGLKTLERYKEKFVNKSYFIAFNNSKKYYYNDKNNSRKGREFIARLDKNNKNDSWFFQTMKKGGKFYLNVDKNSNLDVTNIWINYNIFYNDKVIGVVGTGFELTDFIKLFVKTNNPNDYNIFFDDFLSIQLYQDTNLIDFSSISKDSSEHISLSSIVKDKKELQKIKDVVANAKSKNSIEALLLEIDGKKYLASFSYIKELDWFNMMAIKADSLPMVGLYQAVFSTLFVMIVLFIFFIVFNEFKIITPIKQITDQMINIAENGYNTQIKVVSGKDEIAQLSKEFRKLIKIAQEKHTHLETLVQARTEELLEKQQFLNTVLDNANVYIYTKDKDLNYTYINKAGLKALGNLKLDDVVGKNLNHIYTKETLAEIEKADKAIFTNAKTVSFEEEIKFKNKKSKYLLITKTPLFNKKHKVYSVLGIALDITQRKEQEDIIKEMAFYDTLTNLPNRRLLEKEVTSTLKKDSKKYGALMFIDIDDFKSINDTYSHQVGDSLLVEVARRLEDAIRSTDIVARLGGDEFVIAIKELDYDLDSSKKQALYIANKILKSTNKIYRLEETKNNFIEFSSTLSIGVTLFNDDEPIDSIFQRADKAMYNVKKENKNGVYIL